MRNNYRDLIKLYADREYTGNIISLNNVSHSRIRGFEVMGQTVEVGEGEKAPDNPFQLVGCANPVLKIGEQSMTIPYTLNGIPVTSGGNYTDASGQQWVCDTYNPLTGEYVQRIGKYAVTSSESISLRSVSNTGYLYTLSDIVTDYDRHNRKLKIICSHYNFVNTYDSTEKAVNNMQLNEVSMYTHLIANYWTIYFNVNYDNVTSFKTYLQEQYENENPVTIYYELAEPIVTTLTPTDLYANIPNTTIQLDETNGLGNIKAVLQTKE